MDVEKPKESSIFKNYPEFLADHHARDFVCDTLRMAITGGVEPFDMDQMMELDMEVHHHDATQPVSALTTVADALPGLGIVAAVLGVVITMGSLGGPPEEIGEKVAAALVGTFLGILLCYGVVGPLSSNMSKTADEQNDYLHVLRVLMLSFLKGSAPMIAIEMGRRAIPAHVRPSFDEMEKNCKSRRGSRRNQPRLPRRERFAMADKDVNRSSSSREGRARRPSRRRVEGGLCRLCDRHDVAVHRAVADELEREDQEGGRRLLQRSQGNGKHDGHHDERYGRDGDGCRRRRHAEAEGQARRGDQGEKGSGEALKAD